MRLAIIPARGGSKRIPRKNIMNFCGKPMIMYPIMAARKSGLFDKIHVSTDSDEIRRAVEGVGLKIDFMRDPALADDFTSLLPVYRWTVEQYEKRGEIYDEVCCIMPAAPLLQSEDLKAAFELFRKYESKHPLLVMARYPVPIEWAFRRDKDCFMTAVSSSKIKMRSQDLRDAYYESGPFVIWNKDHLVAADPLSGRILSYVMPSEKVIDIDTLEDIARAEVLYKLLYESLGKQDQ